jgi:DNA mismatch repair protein MSH5
MKDRGSIGCAYYIARDEKLFLMEDIQMAGMDIVDTAKLHAQPTTILISSRADDALENHLASEAKDSDHHDDNQSKPMPSATQIRSHC